MKDSLKISVIIPVYNVEKYLKECVDSVLAQDYSNIEIILVNDGSKDSSPTICDEYAKNYSHIKVIHKENGGLSDARNRGVTLCTGDYVLFLDSDDFWDNASAISKLVSRVNITKCDVLNFSFKKFNEDERVFTEGLKKSTDMPTQLKNKKEQLEFLGKGNLYIACAWNKLIKKDLFDNELIFEKGAYSEDIVWCAILMKKAASFDYIDFSFYCYRQRVGSIAHTITDKSCSDLFNHIKSCMKLCKEDGEEKDALLKYTAYQFATFFVIQALAKNPQKELIKKMKNYRHILKHHGNNKKLKYLHYGCKILGYTNLCKIVKLGYRIKKA